MTGAELAETLGMARLTVSGILTRIGIGKLGRLGLEPAPRDERAGPGELIPIEVKKLGRIHDGAGHRFTGKPGQRKAAATRADAEGVRRKQVGWEYVHVAIDDATGLAYVEVLTDEKATTAIGFLRRAVAHFLQLRHHRRAADHRQRQRFTAQPCTRSHAARSGAAICAPAPTDPRPTAKPSGSSGLCSEAGPTAPSTEQATNATPPSPAGATSTIAADHTAPSATNHR